MDSKIRILYLEDSLSDVLLTKRILVKGGIDFEMLVVDTKDKFVLALSEFSPEIIIADHKLPSFDSLQALSIFLATGMEIPFILLTSSMSDELAVGIIKKGADDYILKDKPMRLPMAIRNSLEKCRLKKEKQIALQELVRNEQRYRSLVENSTDVIAIVSAGGKPMYISPGIKRVLGYTEEEIMQTNVLSSLSHPGDIAAILKGMECVMANPGLPVSGSSSRMRHKDGSWRWMECTATNMLHDPAIRGVVNNFRDVTERKHAEEKAVHANRLYAFISQINQTIVHAADEETVFKEACRIATGPGNFKAAWIGMIDKENKKINLVEEAGISPEDIPIFSNARYDDNGPQNRVLCAGAYYVCNDIQENPGPVRWKAYAVARGFCSCMVLPFWKSGALIGTFNLYSSEINFFNAPEIALLIEATGDISFALDIFEKERLRTLAEQKLKHNELSLNHAQSIARLGSWDHDLATGVVKWSDEALRIHGLGPEENNQSFESWLSFIHPDDLDYVKEETKKGRETQAGMSFFHRIITRHGLTRHIYSEARFEFDSAGKPLGLHGIVHDITNIKEAEEQLRKTEMLNKAILSSLSSHIAVIEESGKIINVNKAWDDFALNNGIHSLQRASIGSNYFDVCAAAIAGGDTIANDAMQGILAVFKKEIKVFELEYPCNSPDEERWFNLNVVNFGTDGTKVVISHVDVSNRKKAEIALEQSEANLRLIVDLIPQYIFARDSIGRFLFVNTSFAKLYGLTPAQLLNHTLTETIPGNNDPINLLVQDQEVMNTGIAKIIPEVKFTDNHGIDRILYTTKVPYAIVGEYTKAVLGIATDVTEQKKAEKLLLLSESNLKAIIENTDASIYSLNRELQYITFNKRLKTSLKALYGIDVKPADYVYKFLQKLSPEEAWGWSEAYSRALNGETVKFEKEFRTGAIYNCSSYSIHPILENENVIGISCFAFDITKQKQDEQHNEKITEDLIQRNKDLEQFSYIISHNLRAPVANIMGLTNLMEIMEPKELADNLLMTDLAVSVKKLDMVIKDLNHILQVKHQVAEKREWVSFSEILDDIKISINNLLQEDNVNIITDFSAVDEIRTLKSYLHSIFYNLISNSIKYRRPGIQPIIEIKSWREKNKIELIFKDNGLGIDLEKRGEHVFGLYKRFHSHTEGKGIGLYMVKTQVEAVGGKITIASEVNKGTQFNIVFNYTS